MPGAMISKDQAKDLARRHAFTCTDSDWDDLTDDARARRTASGETEHGRVILHCKGSFTGADWDLDDVLVKIDQSRACAFMPDDVFGHCLYVQMPAENGRYRTWKFQVPAEADVVADVPAATGG